MPKNTAVWDENGFLTDAKGTEYVVQRESVTGAMAMRGRWVFYLLRRRKGERELAVVEDTERSRESSVRRIAEKLAGF